MAGVHAAPKESSGISAAQLVLGQPLVLPGELKAWLRLQLKISPLSWHLWILPLRASHVLMKQWPPPTSPPPSSCRRPTTCTYVRRGGTIPPLAPVYSGPYRVLHAGPKVFTLEVGATRKSVSVDRLKPHNGPLPVIPALPARRGRPKK